MTEISPELRESVEEHYESGELAKVYELIAQAQDKARLEEAEWWYKGGQTAFTEEQRIRELRESCKKFQ